MIDAESLRIEFIKDAIFVIEHIYDCAKLKTHFEAEAEPCPSLTCLLSVDNVT